MMQPLGLIKCKSCGGESYFSKEGYYDCRCYVGFAGMKDEDCEMYLDELPEDVVIVYLELDDESGLFGSEGNEVKVDGYACPFCNKTHKIVYQIGINDYCFNCLSGSEKASMSDVHTLWNYYDGPTHLLPTDGSIMILEEE